MYFDDHLPAHFHVITADHREALVALEDNRILAELTFRTGEKLDIDFAARARNRPKLKPLLDPEIFEAGRIVDGGIAVEWPCGIEIDATSLHRTALAMRFRAWRKGHGMSQTLAAAALGLTSRTVQNYEAGEQDIPRTVMLAMRGFDASPDLRDGIAMST